MKVKIYRAYLIPTGRHGIETWLQIEGKPEVDNDNFFYTFEEAHSALVAKFGKWVHEQKDRLAYLKTLDTEKIFSSSENPEPRARCFTEG
jgi:hypothetical protein